MFTSFFYLLRARGLKVSLNEWMSLIEALDKGLHNSSFTGFYYLCRAILVKSEADFDKFDGAFLEYFKDMERATDELPKELLDWLNKPREELDGSFSEEDLLRNMGLSEEEIQRMFRERLQEQHEQHNGGSKWIGTRGASPFGNNGQIDKGIRVGGVSQKRSAFQVAGDRKFRDFREDNVLDTRQFQMAFRRLRQFSARADEARSEFDIDGTIRETCDNAGSLKVVYDKPRRNTVKVLLLMDSGGSMDYYSKMCSVPGSQKFQPFQRPAGVLFPQLHLFQDLQRSPHASQFCHPDRMDFAEHQQRIQGHHRGGCPDGPLRADGGHMVRLRR